MEMSRGCETRYHGPTNHRPARISAKNLTSGKRLCWSWDQELDAYENHASVAAELLKSTNLIAVSINNGGYIFVVK